MNKTTCRCTAPLLFGLFALTLGCDRNESLAQLPESTKAEGPPKVRVAPVHMKIDRDSIEATGTAAPMSTTKIMPLVPGIIKKLTVHEGDIVKKGQVLAVLDQRNYQLTLRQAKAAVEGADVALQAATREKKRFDKLMKQDATARAQYEQILDKYRGAQIKMKAAQVDLAKAKKALNDTVLRAPYTGVVVKKMASIGDYATSMPPTVLLVLMQISTLQLKVSLPEPDLPRVQEGAGVTIRFPSISREIEASVTRIMRNVDPLTRSFEVIVEIPNEDMSLKPGLFAEVEIAASKPRQRLLIPVGALVDEGSGVHSVMVAERDAARRREVRVIAASSDMSEVTSGLEGDEQVILDPSGILDGDAIRVSKSTNLDHPTKEEPGPAAHTERVSAAGAPAETPAGAAQ
jgi:RND family efflux transporter MFP subunit